MSLKRKEIRQALKAALLGKTVAGDRVYARRAHALWKVETPAILIFARLESSEAMADNRVYPPLLRTLTATIQGRLETSGEIDDRLDEIASEIETALEAAGDFGGLIDRITLSSTEIDIEDTGNKPVGSIEMSFEIQYRDR